VPPINPHAASKAASNVRANIEVKNPVFLMEFSSITSLRRKRHYVRSPVHPDTFAYQSNWSCQRAWNQSKIALIPCQE
jgi:hypothetical protein